MTKETKGTVMHEYMRRIEKAISLGTLPMDFNPGVNMIEVRHDKWCKVYKSHECNCDPVIIIEQKSGDMRIFKDGTCAPVKMDG